MGKQVVHRCPVRIGDADEELFFLAEEYRHARQRSAGADRTDEGVDFALGLFPDFRAGREIMRHAIVEVVPLVGEQHAVLFGLAQFVGEPVPNVLVVVGIAVGHRRHFDEFGATEPQHSFFLALGVGNDDQRAIAARVGDKREADAGVAGGALDHEAAGLQSRRAFRPPGSSGGPGRSSPSRRGS